MNSFSDDINIEFALDNCAKATCKQGELISIESIILDIDTGSYLRVSELELRLWNTAFEDERNVCHG